MLMTQRYLLLSIFCLIPLFVHSQTVEYVRNDGQWDAPFRYKASIATGDVFLSEKSMTVLLGHAANHDLVDEVKHGYIKGPVNLKFHSYRVHFEGALTPKITSSKEQSWYYNYMLGKDPSRWKSNIHPALGVDYTRLYEGIDMHISSEKGNVKYEFIVAPGADPSKIRLRYEGQDGLSISKGNLIIKTSIGDVQELKPYAYQYLENGKKEVACRYRIKNDILTYDLYEDYDATKPLIIDPTLVFSTFTGSTADNWGYTATYDAAGNFYGGGAVLFYPTSGGGAFPVSPGAFQATFGGGINDPNNNNDDTAGLGIACDVGVIKYNSTGTIKIYATYIGGSNNEVPHSMIVDANNNLIIAGKTHSRNFPVTNAGYDTSYNGNGDIFIVKLNPTGTALLGGTYLGGTDKDGSNFNASETIFGNLKYNYGDDARSEVLVDNAGNIYMAGSSHSTNFPLMNATQASNGGGQDGVVVKLNSTLSTLIWSTYLGGSNDDAGYVMALDNTQTHLYVGGGTMSNNFPTTGTTWRPAYQGGFSDGYIARYLNSGSYNLEKVCFIGTANMDQVYGVQVDLDNNVYAMGQSLGGQFPVSSGVYSNPNSSQFVIKLNTDLSTNIYSTVFGSGDPAHTNISPVAFLVDTCQNVYISGWGGNLAINTVPSTVGTTNGMPTTPATAIQNATDGFDFYFIVLSKNAQALLYGSYYGRSSTAARFGEHVDGGTSRFDKNGVVYQAICGGCGGTSGPALPTTPGSFSPVNGSVNCNLASLKIEFQLGAVVANSNASPTTRGCPPLTVQFQNTSTNAVSYLWIFGDNTANSTQPAPSHTFSNPGVYRVMLVATNPNACKPVDTSYVTITVDSARISNSYSVAVTDSCDPYRIAITNTSQYSTTPGSAAFTQFRWDFGDGNTATGFNPGSHSYASPGTYTITMTMTDTTACNSPSTVNKTITITSPKVAANFTVKDSLCEGIPITLTDNSSNATGLRWNLGNGDTSTAATVTRTYAAGTYTISLTSTNPNTCNKKDSISRTVTIFPVPDANFTFAPVIPIPNTPVTFTNTSKQATDYAWSFGDNSVSTEVNPTHLYRKSGKYNVCLAARNKQGCVDTVCKQVEADILTRAELPTAFSPNGDGNNDRFYVRGGGIEKSHLKIFNRWGQMVFESVDAPANQEAYGWDGTYKGKEQEMEVYAFVLEVTYIDGSTAQRKGNVTLIR